jgi:hypothetical protein
MSDRSPRESMQAECRRLGRDAAVAECVRLVRGEDVGPEFLWGLVGQAAAKYFDGREHHDTYWLRVWGMRGLLWVWDDGALEAVLTGLDDEHWRVREMAAKVVARNLVGDALPAVAALRDDPVPRVRTAAARAVAALTGAGA